MIIGSHVSFGGKGLLGSATEAVSYGANTFMCYTGAPQNTLRKPFDEESVRKAHEYMQENGINPENIICHAPYIINLANKSKPEAWEFSVSFLKQELKRCEALGIKYIVLHPGSAVSHTKEEALENIADTTVGNIVGFAEKGQCPNELCFRCGSAEDCKTGKCF